MRARLLKVFMVILVLLPVGLTAYLANSLYHRKGVPEALENLTKQLFQSKEEERKAETRAKVLERKTEELQTAYDALVADLRGEVDSREIRVRQFREKLEINFVDKVLFASGSADITPKGRDILGRVGAVLGKVKGKSIYVVGHTDNMPIHSSLYPSNWELSAARASSVIRHLSEATGLSPERFTAMGRSFYQPVASNATPEGRQENRRVDIIVADVPLLAGETGSQSTRGTVGGPEAAPEGDGEGQPLRQTAPAPHGDGPDAAVPAKTEPAKPGSEATPPTPAVTPPAAGPASAPAPAPATGSSSKEPSSAPAKGSSPASPGAAATPEPTPDKAVAAPASPAKPENTPASAATDTSPASPAAAPDAPEQPGEQAKPAPAGQDQPPAAPAEAAGKTPAAAASPQPGQSAGPYLPPPLPAAPGGGS